MGEDYKPESNNGETHVDVKISSSIVQCSNGKAIVALPVRGGASGEGLPYAPVNWPCMGDTWKWKVGNRITPLGYWQDKSLQAPKHLPNLPAFGLFRSRVSLQQYIEKEFPGTNVHAFFSSFINKVPASSNDSLYEQKIAQSTPTLAQSKAELAQSTAELASTCKAGNTICKSRSRTYALPPSSCDICCSESGFCRDCCCILCCKPIEFSCEGLNFIKCEARMSEMFICGHVTHVDCALRARLAGKVSGTIDLDAQYFCRRCDNKTDLLSHVSKIINACESIYKNEDVKKLLNLGLRLLRNSERESAKTREGIIAELMVEHNCAIA